MLETIHRVMLQTLPHTVLRIVDVLANDVAFLCGSLRRSISEADSLALLELLPTQLQGRCELRHLRQHQLLSFRRVEESPLQCTSSDSVPTPAVKTIKLNTALHLHPRR